MSVHSLERALAAIGLAGTVEVRGSLAVLRVAGTVSLADDEVRDAAVELATRHGFSHIALELPADQYRAPLHRD